MIVLAVSDEGAKDWGNMVDCVTCLDRRTTCDIWLDLFGDVQHS